MDLPPWNLQRFLPGSLLFRQFVFFRVLAPQVTRTVLARWASLACHAANAWAVASSTSARQSRLSPFSPARAILVSFQAGTVQPSASAMRRTAQPRASRRGARSQYWTADRPTPARWASSACVRPAAFRRAASSFPIGPLWGRVISSGSRAQLG
ncbi:hypothetical protein JCM7686_1018 [Paracoccus aminophilus JCM 7686]|uniref:Uncharacterized protein n=1 Tax=Paracoccus aminophilus JCM 7686 TaxID=1367847 RepID=S5XSN2_PARAH|nr:hypothetical protein JCM7686_1018 [Paracoccus aminophilus JCM 7686]